MFLEKGSLITLDAGHNCWPDTGASGIKQEDNLTKEVVSLLIPKFQSLGYKTKDCTPYGVRFNSVNGSLAYRVQQANISGSSLHLCIHFNCGGGKGTESWISGPGGKSEQFATQITNEIAKLGYTNRGVKSGNLYVPKYTNMPCVLVEGAFVDSSEDMNRYNADAIANAIVKGVIGQVAPSSVPVETKAPVVNVAPVKTSYIVANAVIQNDFFYVRDSERNVIPGRIDIGDKVQILDISYSKQLVLVKYPTANGSRTEYIKNVPGNIKYLYEYQWQNGSTDETVYQDSSCTQPIGSLSSYEKATPLYRRNGVLHVAYNTSLGNHTKSGYVKYNGGFSQF